MATARNKKKIKEFNEVEIGPDEPIYPTGVVCRILNIPIWVLKQLDREGIVSPPREYDGKARLYSKRELKMVKHSWFYLREHKVKIEGLKIILKMEAGTFKSS